MSREHRPSVTDARAPWDGRLSPGTNAGLGNEVRRARSGRALRGRHV